MLFFFFDKAAGLELRWWWLGLASNQMKSLLLALSCRCPIFTMRRPLAAWTQTAMLLTSVRLPVTPLPQGKCDGGGSPPPLPPVTRCSFSFNRVLKMYIHFNQLVSTHTFSTAMRELGHVRPCSVVTQGKSLRSHALFIVYLLPGKFSKVIRRQLAVSVGHVMR